MPRSRPDRDRYYRQGEFWLGHLPGKGEESPFYIFWYDPDARRIQRRSTGAGDLRLAKDVLDEHYRAVHQPTADERTAYTVHEAMVDYWQEHGSKQSPAEAIKARLKLLRRFLDAEIAAGRLREPVLPARVDDRLLDRFRHWATKVDGIVTRKRDRSSGDWIETTRPRSAATAEESVIQLKAALNHNRKRMSEVPDLKHKTRATVSAPRLYRLSIDQIAEMLDYTARGDHGRIAAPVRMLPLRRFLIGAICTLARPDAIFDISVLHERQQWDRNGRVLDLNPLGRIQTRKHRAVVPVVELLENWLGETEDRLVCSEVAHADEHGEWLLQSSVASVKKAWTAMRPTFGIPDSYGPKLMRHSTATLLANLGVPADQISTGLGHNILEPSTRHYVTLQPGYLRDLRTGLEELTATLARKAGLPIRAKSTQVGEDGRRRRQP